MNDNTEKSRRRYEAMLLDPARHERHKAAVRARYERYRQDPEFVQKANERKRRALQEAKAAALEVLGGACRCCGESEVAFLQVDHADGSGKEHRRGRNPTYVYKDVVSDPGRFQLLCANCHQAKTMTGSCPHGGLLS